MFLFINLIHLLLKWSKLKKFDLYLLNFQIYKITHLFKIQDSIKFKLHLNLNFCKTWYECEGTHLKERNILQQSIINQSESCITQYNTYIRVTSFDAFLQYRYRISGYTYVSSSTVSYLFWQFRQGLRDYYIQWWCKLDIMNLYII